MPIKDFQTSSKKFEKSPEFFSSHRKSIQKEIRTIFSNSEKRISLQGENFTENKSFLDYISIARKNNPVKCEQDLTKSMLIKKLENKPKNKKKNFFSKEFSNTMTNTDSQQFLTEAPSKIFVKITKKEKTLFSSLSKALKIENLTAPFGIKLRGKKPNKQETSTSPMFLKSFTPNSSFNFNIN